MTELGFVHQFIPRLVGANAVHASRHRWRRTAAHSACAPARSGRRHPQPAREIIGEWKRAFLSPAGGGSLRPGGFAGANGRLADFVRQAATRYRFDRTKTVTVGYSNGANIAASILLRHPEVLRTAMLLRAMVPFQPEELPDLSGVGIWIAGGNQDPLIPRLNTERLAEMLNDAGAEVTAHFFEAGHALTNTELVLAKRWLDAL